jgi:hypothetical protein
MIVKIDRMPILAHWSTGLPAHRFREGTLSHKAKILFSEKAKGD